MDLINNLRSGEWWSHLRDFDLDNEESQNYSEDDIKRAVYFVSPNTFGNDVARLKYGLPFTPTGTTPSHPLQMSSMQCIPSVYSERLSLEQVIY